MNRLSLKLQVLLLTIGSLIVLASFISYTSVTLSTEALTQNAYNNLTSLKDISQKRTNKNIDNSIKLVFSNSAVNGIVIQNEFFDKDIANR